MKKLFFILSAVVLLVTLSSFALTGKRCPNCNSTNTKSEISYVTQKCKGCNGKGTQRGEKCTNCGGKGTDRFPKTVNVCNDCGRVW